MKHHAQDPPLALDSDFAQSDTAWAKAMERLKSILTMTVRRYFFPKERSRIGISVANLEASELFMLLAETCCAACNIG